MRTIRVALCLLCLAAFAHTASAQLPTNNLVWKARCTMLQGLATQIEAGDTPAVLVKATREIPSIQFATFAFERSRAGEHYVACTLFYMAAIAERAGNGGTGKVATARNLGIVAGSEFHLATHVKPTMKEHVKRGEEEAKQVSAKALTGEQSAAIIGAADVLPVTLTPSKLP